MSSTNNVLTYKPKKPVLTTDPLELGAYIEAGYELIPLKEKGKEPRDKGWRQHTYTKFDAEKWMKRGDNIGVRLRTCDLVIDFDPRNSLPDDNPLERFMKDFGLEPEKCAYVETGSGGAHIYLKKPPSCQVRGHLEAYPGLEFKTFGTQVVAAGSLHPNGKRYFWDGLAGWLSDTPNAPEKLLDALRRPVGQASVEAKKHTPEQMADMIDKLDPTAFRDEKKWRDLMMACHHATAGEGMEEFIEWSVSDPQYADHHAIIAKRWESLDSNGTGKITHQTLYKALHDAGHGGVIPTETTAEEDFSGENETLLKELSTPLRKLCDEWVWVGEPFCFVHRHENEKDGPIWSEPRQWSADHGHLMKKGSICQAAWKGELPIRKFSSLVYLPGEAEFPDGLSGRRYNIWRASGIEPKPGDVSPLLEHAEYMFPRKDERELFLDYLSLLVRQDAPKLMFALVIKSKEGVGKGRIGMLLRRMLGDTNVKEPGNDLITGKFQSWAHGVQLVIVHELMASHKIELMDRLKSVITEEKIYVDVKFKRPHTIDNRANFLFFTNHATPLRLRPGDRRYAVLSTDVEPRETAYYDKLSKFVESDDGAAAAKYYLLSRVTNLNPKGRAPETEAKAEMTENARSTAEFYLAEQLARGEPPFDRDLVTRDDVAHILLNRIDRPLCPNPYKAASSFLEICGAMKAPRDKNPGGSSVQLYILRDKEKWLAAGAVARAAAYKNMTHVTHEKGEDED